MIKACMPVGDNVWTLTYIKHSDNTVEILDFTHEDNDGYMFRETLGKLDSILESDDGQRIALEVTINGESFRVRNQQHILTYKQPL